MDRALAYEASLECIRNSKQLLDDGRVLFQKKSYGHTFALLVLAEEELGKAFLWILQTIGVDIPKGILTRDHVAKQVVSVTIFDEDNLRLFAHVGRILSIASGPGSQRERQELIRRADRRFTDSWNGAVTSGAMKERAQSAFSRLFELEKRKWAGLYVDISMDREGILSPREFPRAETQGLLGKVTRIHHRLATTFDITTKLTSKEIDDWIQPQMGAIRRNLSDMVRNLESVARYFRNYGPTVNRPAPGNPPRERA